MADWTPLLGRYRLTNDDGESMNLSSAAIWSLDLPYSPARTWMLREGRRRESSSQARLAEEERRAREGEGDAPESTVHLDLLLDADEVGVDCARHLAREEALAGDELAPLGVEDALLRVVLDEVRVGEGVERVGEVDGAAARCEEGVLLERLDEELGVDGAEGLGLGRVGRELVRLGRAAREEG